MWAPVISPVMMRAARTQTTYSTSPGLGEVWLVVTGGIEATGIDRLDYPLVVPALLDVDPVALAGDDAGKFVGPDLAALAVGGNDPGDVAAGLGWLDFADLDQHVGTSRVVGPQQFGHRHRLGERRQCGRRRQGCTGAGLRQFRLRRHLNGSGRDGFGAATISALSRAISASRASSGYGVPFLAAKAASRQANSRHCVS
jgi:hypothetical protein